MKFVPLDQAIAVIVEFGLSQVLLLYNLKNILQ